MTEPYQPADTDDELLPVVDWDDRVVGEKTRREIHEQGLLHRAVHVVVADGHGKIVLQKRSSEKDRYPGWWDVSVGGHVNPGEIYLETAQRELGEELGVNEVQPILVGIIPPSVLTGWEHVHVFAALVTDELKPDEKEIDGVLWIQPEDLFATFSSETDDETKRITPSGLNSTRLWWETGAMGLRKKV